jgi:hypothetical protein
MLHQPGFPFPRSTSNPTVAAPADESLVADTRAGLTPAQFVERKLLALLKSDPMPISLSQGFATPGVRGRRG